MTPQEREVLRKMYVGEVTNNPELTAKIACIHLAIQYKEKELASELIGIMHSQSTSKVIGRAEAAELWGMLTKRVDSPANFSLNLAQSDFEFNEGEVFRKKKEVFYNSAAIYRLAQATVL